MAKTEKRIATIPNLLSLIRLLSIPVFIWVLFGHDNRLLAAVILAGAGLTDFLDGYIARKFNQKTQLGRRLDAVVDIVYLGSVSLALMLAGPRWLNLLGGFVFVRGAVLGLYVLYQVGYRHKAELPVLFAGKAATLCLMTAIPLALAYSGTQAGARIFLLVPALVFLAFGIPLSVFTAFHYISTYRKLKSKE